MGRAVRGCALYTSWRQSPHAPSSIPGRTDPLQPLVATTSPEPSHGKGSEHILYVFPSAGGVQGLPLSRSAVSAWSQLHLSAPAHCYPRTDAGTEAGHGGGSVAGRYASEARPVRD